jgi:pimeloyl-ACP methyl ester carboxylesterase
MIPRLLFPAFLLGVVFFLGGCATPDGLPQNMPDRAARMPYGYLYYLDGAGGGTAKKNWSAGVKKGLLEGGYPGAGEMFTWETGRGLIADQDASVAYKRAKAKEMAREVEKQVKAFPDAPVDVLGFSAGTAVAIFALEALPPSVQVENVVLLGASISNDYDLTEALKRVRGKVYLYTSRRDRMLGFFMGFSGTADRKFVPGAGERGFVLPRNAGPLTKKLYAEKLRAIPWTPTLAADGDFGRHFDNVKMKFIRDHVAPLLMDSPGT